MMQQKLLFSVSYSSTRRKNIRSLPSFAFSWSKFHPISVTGTSNDGFLRQHHVTFSSTTNDKTKQEDSLKNDEVSSNNNQEKEGIEKNNTIQQINAETLQKLVSFSRPEHSLVGWSASTLLITSSSTLILPTASGKVLDMILSGDPSVSPTLIAGGLFVLTAMAGSGVYFRTLWLQRAGNTLVARLKQQLYGSMLQQEIAYFDRMKTGDLMTRLSQDTTMIQSAVTTQAVSAMRGIVMSTGSAFMLFQTSTTLAMVSLGTLPPLFLAARHVGQNLRDKQRYVQELHSHASAIAEEGLNGISTVVQFGAEGQEWKRYSHAVTKAHEAAIQTGKIQALFDGAVHIAANGAVLCVLGYGGSMVIAGSISAGDLTGFLMYSLLLAGNVSSLSGTYAEVMKAVAAADRVWEILERQSAIPSSLDDDEEVVTTHNHPVSVEFQNVEFAYPTRPDKVVLGPNFCLKVQPGEVLALVGSSGSGKSTIASLLTRLYDIDNPNRINTTGVTSKSTSGILVNGKDIRNWDANELRRRMIGIVSQSPWLLDGTIEDNIRYGRPSASYDEVQQAAENANVLSFSNFFKDGLQTKVGPRGTQLSGGQIQRVAIARLLLKDPPIVVLDEATSALDSQSEQFVNQAIDSAMKGRTVISIAHRLSTIRSADRIAVLQDGQVAEIGTFEDLSQRENGVFKALMGRQLISSS